MSNDRSSGAVGCCRCCCSFIFTSGLTALFMWLSLRGSNPTCSIRDFYVPALNLSADSTVRRNQSLYFDLQLQNGMKDKGVGYDDLNLTFYYGPPNTSLPIGNYTVTRFNQGHGKKTHRRELVGTHGVPWPAASAAVSNGTVIFGVDLSTKVRYKILFWYTKRHKLMVRANVDVNGTGQKVNKKGVKLRSAAPESRRYHLAPIYRYGELLPCSFTREKYSPPRPKERSSECDPCSATFPSLITAMELAFWMVDKR